ncbi:hypothetical protein CI109_100833 [Kwoniella shandongensis]|uniref:histone acetyltransferase n=1 Tax=Kwoniella shandongensis TaxID=1734106 RepID=A0A5M6BUU2_9TREE|nr:uncharacterized protein CI109_006923 [Kwoniella shandongensis]KAA5524769.1 hypothetical protein CI109_006923 [Kwoniella shandongensis]
MSFPSGGQSISLRDHLLASLSTLPNAHKLSLTLLISEPKRTSTLFPHTPHPPRCLQQEYLVVLSSEMAEKTEGPAGTNPSAVEEPALVESSAALDPTSTTTTPLQSDTKPTPSRVLVSAISAYLYTFPSASDSTKPILYISKVDSSGYTPQPLPYTRNLIRSFLTYFVTSRPDLPSLRIQLFARAQRQYLFANSADGPLKKVLGGAGLCKWWKGVYEDVCVEVMAASMSQQQLNTDSPTGNGSGSGGGGGSGPSSAGVQIQRQGERLLSVKYLLPGYDEIEARNMLGPGRPLPQVMEWKYEPPFGLDHSSNTTVANSTSTSSSKDLPPSLANLIPSLPDDPKTRFLEELVADAPTTSHHGHVSADGQTKPTSTSDQSNTGETSAAQIKIKTKKEREAEEEESIRRSAHLTLSRVTPTEFWERMGFRQECASGDVTGFFTLESSAISTSTSSSLDADTDTDHHSIESKQKTTEATSSTSLGVETSSASTSASSSGSTPTFTPQLRQEITDRILVALTNIDFATLPLAKEGTEIWLNQVRSLVSGEVGQTGWERCNGDIEAKTEDEVKAQLGAVGGTVRKQREEVVTMLQPRKKKKPAV